MVSIVAAAIFVSSCFLLFILSLKLPANTESYFEVVVWRCLSRTTSSPPVKRCIALLSLVAASFGGNSYSLALLLNQLQSSRQNGIFAHCSE